MPFKAVFERGFSPFGKRTYWNVKRWFFFDNSEDFFKKLEELKGKTLIFYLSFEGGYPFLNLKGKRGTIPPYGVGILEECKSFKGLEAFKAAFKGSSLEKEGYLKRFQTIKNYIERGDIYQVNFTVRFDFEFEGDPLGLWERFIKKQPVPCGVFLETPHFTAIGGSMELFLQKEGEILKSSPIKGTLPSYENPKKFFELEKELAENLMITDMVRNDLGRVSEIGSVKVEKLFEVQTFKTVHQLVSTVVSKSKKPFGEIIEATFLPASVTGAPKRRAVEIINELEPHTRELYCGTVGLMLPNGDFTANVSIRTALLMDNLLSYYAGGGIVWDSEGEKEWREVLLKVKAFKETLKGT